jgi:hypothetical protein
MNAVGARPVSTVPAGMVIARYLMALALSKKLGVRPEAIAAETREWRSTPQVAECLKAAVPGAVTTDSDWAQPLSRFGIIDDYLSVLRATSGFGQLESRFRRVPFYTPVVRELGTGVGMTWIPESYVYPLVVTGYDSLMLPALKFGGISVAGNELLRLGDPIAERTMRDTHIAGSSRFLDAQLLDPSVTAITGERPGAITAGVSATSSTGSTAAQISGDLASMIAAVTTEGPFVWTMRPATFMTIALKIPGIATPGTLLGQPVVLTPHGPQQITLIDPNEIAYAIDPQGIDISLSNQTSITMTDAGGPPTSAQMVSLFQTNATGFKTTFTVNWVRARDGSVAYMAVTY